MLETMDPAVRSALRSAALFLVCSVAVPVAVVVTILATLLLAPLPATLPSPRPTVASQVSHIYAIDPTGTRQEIGVFREFEQNIPVKKSDIPLVLKQAVVASEDKSFYKHGGVDPRGSLRALWADIRGVNLSQGGSTITQQYVKNAYVGEERTIMRKVREAFLARQLSRQVDKEEILFKYLSNIYLGEGTYGVGAASESYFRKPVSQLTLSEAALLAGLIPAPSRYEPRGNPILAEQKRRQVLDRMLEQGYINQRQHAEAIAQPVWLARQGRPSRPLTVVHPSQQQETRYPYFVDYVRRYLVAKYGPAKVFRGGLDITVTLDPRLQAEAEASVAETLNGTQPPLEMSLVAVEPPTGYVKAMVGGRDFNASQVNLALGGCPPRPRDPKHKVEVDPICWEGKSVEGGGTGRQPGSAFKPFVLATALSNGFLPNRVYRAPATYRIPNCRPTPASKCTIGNAEGSGGGSADIRRATIRSINTVYAQIVRDTGCKETAQTAKKLGLTSAWYSPQFHTCSGTYALGVIDVSPLDMASSFGVFATRGQRVEPSPVLVVTERAPSGGRRVLEDNTKPEGQRVLDELVADTVNDILKGVITGGTGRAANIDRPAAGKTGTGQNYTNAWFVGYTPTLSTAVWMGYSNNQATALRDIKGRDRVFGGTFPAETWQRFMKAALANVPPTEFTQPPPVTLLADIVGRAARGGFDPGDQRPIQQTGRGGPYIVEQPLPPPEETTTTTSPSTQPSGTQPPPPTSPIRPPLLPPRP